MSDQNKFVRGDIFEIFLPESDLIPEHTPPSPDILLHGKHKMICLTSYNDNKTPSGQVLMIPISTAKSAVSKKRITDTHFPLEKDTFKFLDENSYVLLFSPRPIGRHWLNTTNYVCNINEFDENIMKKISVLSLFANGSYDDVMEMVYEKLNELIQKNNQSL